MSNILQVTDPSTYIDNRNVHTGQEQQSALNSSQIQNPSDPSRVVRADGQKSGTAGDQENESGFSVRNYNGNYTDFLQKLGHQSPVLPQQGQQQVQLFQLLMMILLGDLLGGLHRLQRFLRIILKVHKTQLLVLALLQVEC